MAIPPAVEIRAALERILASPRFAGAGKLSRFLAFIVEKSLAGEGEEIKEYLIALEVYQRQASYNPRVDSIVRVEASRLRLRLREYYEAEGQDDPVRIGLRKGRYVPDFELRQVAPPDPPAPSPAAPRVWTRTRILAAVGLGSLLLLASFLAWYRAWPWTPPATGHDRSRAIAVLPFEDFSPDGRTERFGAGLSEEITEDLSRSGGLQVASRTSAFQFKGKSDSVRAIGLQLGVGAVLEGSVRREGKLLRITAQLASTVDGFHLWSATYDRASDNLLDVQSEVAHLIGQAVRIRLTGTPPRTGAGNAALDAQQLSRKGWDRLTLGTADSLLENRNSRGIPGGTFAQVTESIRLFERAIAADPNCASAHAGLAAAWLGAADFDAHALEHVRPAAQRALALDEQSPEAHAALGYLDFFYEWDFPAARRELLRALESRPRDALITRLYADAASLTGDMTQPLARLRGFAAGDKEALAIHAEIGILLYHMRRFQELDAYAAEVQRDHPDFSLGYWLRGLALEQLGQPAQAIQQFRECARLSPGELRGGLALAYALSKAGHRDEAIVLIDGLEYGRSWTARSYAGALVEAGCGNRSAALGWLERALEQRYSGLAFMKLDPRFDGVRSDPRFVAILKKLRL